MAHDWRDLFLLDDDAPAAPAPATPTEGEPRGGFFRRLRDNLSKTRHALSAEVQATLLEGDLDDAAWERLEEALIYADVGARTTAEVVERLEREATEEHLAPEALRERLVELLAQAAVPDGDTRDRIDLRHRPTVILAVGVNGTGKTTTIGKLAWHLHQTLGRGVLIGAADTFRAAAVEQLEEWA
nr:signal recognition particle receptor subunit alpha [Actinomycetota bacterium]